MSINRSKVKFSQHAQQQFQMRLTIDPLNALIKIREVFESSIEITHEEAKKYINENIVDKYNNKTTFYFKTELAKGFGIFIVRDNVVITFKTSYENELFDVLNNYEKSRRVIKQKRTNINKFY